MSELKLKEEYVAPLEERMKQFNAEFISLLSKYHLGLGAEPVISAKPVLIDLLKKAEEPKPEGNGLAHA